MNEMTKSMKGVWLTGHGELDKLDVRNDIPVPKLTANDVLIRVGAAAVNNTDINTRTAWYSKGDATTKDASWAGIAIDFPRVQGIDVCGHIVAVGKNVSNNRIAERVLVE
ncbi:MAG: alcohol dehydrogenase, partial [Proteobacteria bacterium]